MSDQTRDDMTECVLGLQDGGGVQDKQCGKKRKEKDEGNDTSEMIDDVRIL